MKQCIMSENRFDFLRELVRTVPDINVEEQQFMNQSYNGGSASDPDEESLPPSRPIVSYAPSTNGITSFGESNTNAYISATGDNSYHPRVENSNNKTPPYAAHPPYFETIGRSLMINKQQSLDLSLPSSTSSSSEIRTLNTTRANYYTEIKSEDTSDETDVVITPKIARLNSAPVYGLSRTAPSTPAAFTDTPVINFDFTKGLAGTYMSPFPASATVKIEYNPTTTSSTHMPRISVNVLPTNNTPPMPGVNHSRDIVIQNAPKTPINTTRINNHVIDMRTPSPSSTSSSSSSSTAAANSRQYTFNVRPVKDIAKVPAPRGRPPKHRIANPTAQPVVDHHADTPNSSSSFTCAVRASPSPSPSSSSTAHKTNGFTLPAPPKFVSATNTCLDMDEDYDTI